MLECSLQVMQLVTEKASAMGVRLVAASAEAMKNRKLNYARPAFESRPFPGREKLCDSGVLVCLASSDSADPKKGM